MTIQEEIQSLQRDEETPQETQVDLKTQVKSAIQEMDQQKAEDKRQLELNYQMQAQQQQDSLEKQEKDEVIAQATEALKTEYQSNPDFKTAIDGKDLQTNIINLVADVAEPEEAIQIIRELANNDEYLEKIKRSRTVAGMHKILKKINKDVLRSSNSHGQISPIVKKNITNYDPNQGDTTNDSDFYDKIFRNIGL